MGMHEFPNTPLKIVKATCGEGVYIVNSEFRAKDNNSMLFLRYANFRSACCICLENRLSLYTREIRLYFTPCSESHLICHECIIKLVNRSWFEMIDVICPLCRKTLLKYCTDQ